MLRESAQTFTLRGDVNGLKLRTCTDAAAASTSWFDRFKNVCDQLICGSRSCCGVCQLQRAPAGSRPIQSVSQSGGLLGKSSLVSPPSLCLCRLPGLFQTSQSLIPVYPCQRRSAPLSPSTPCAPQPPSSRLNSSATARTFLQFVCKAVGGCRGNVRSNC